MLMKLWFSSSFNKEQFSISKNLPEVDKLLKNIPQQTSQKNLLKNVRNCCVIIV